MRKYKVSAEIQALINEFTMSEFQRDMERFGAPSHIWAGQSAEGRTFWRLPKDVHKIPEGTKFVHKYVLTEQVADWCEQALEQEVDYKKFIEEMIKHIRGRK